jgi:tRNA U55 pseudouridine synthase TruB
MGGAFDIENAVTLDQIERLAKTPEIDALLQPVALGLSDLPELRSDRGRRGKAEEWKPRSRPSG